MDEIERRHRWANASPYERYDMLWPRRSPPPEPAPVRKPIADGPVVSDEERAHTLQTALAKLAIENALAAEVEKVEKVEKERQARSRATAYLSR